MSRGSIVALSLAAGLTGAAVAKELRLPNDERRWHGELWGAIPYDLRPPTPERVRAKLWNPEGPLLSPHLFGVGWAPNLGRVARGLGRA